MAGDTYREAGVDIEACDNWLDSLKSSLPALGGFGGLFPLGPHIAQMKNPCLVAGADGVGTKILVAQAAGDHSTVGIDCVAMVVNDLLCCGGRPIFFLDYLAVGKFNAEQADAILNGIKEGCEQSGCDLLGGETAELPGLLPNDEYDVCGFGVGVVDQSNVIDGKSITPGDVVIGLSSSGLHSNGFSLARHILPEYEQDKDLAQEMLTPTVIYVKPVLELMKSIAVKGIAHITGGGLPGNLCRALPTTVDANLDTSKWERPEIYAQISAKGVSDAEMYKTFNMGIGMCLVVNAKDTEAALKSLGNDAQVIGEVGEGTGKVNIAGLNEEVQGG